MSKSSTNDAGTIWLSDDETKTAKKIMSATTDASGLLRYDPAQQPGLANLLEIIAAIQGQPLDSVLGQELSGYAELKRQVAELVNEELRPVRARFVELKKDPGFVASQLAHGASKAMADAAGTISELRSQLGILTP
jgi:tryptophanyl-tRNA synthetase